MEILSNSWFSEMGMDDPIFMDQCDIMDSFDEELAAALGDDFHSSFSSELSSSSSTLIPRNSSTTTLCASSSMELASHFGINERPSKQIKPNSYANCTIGNMDNCSSAPIILSFGNSNLPENAQQMNMGSVNAEEEAVSDVLMSSFASVEESPKGGGGGGAAQGTKRGSGGRTRPPSQTYDHIIAERKRREMLSQRFVALSAIVPGLKKMDKTSVLGDAIVYLKHLQERVKMLEEQSAKQTMESVVLVKKTQVVADDDGEGEGEGSSDENFGGGGPSGDPLPEIEARVCDKSVLLRIQCEKHRGVLVSILSKVEKLNLAVVNASVVPFGSLALDVTIVTEMDKEFNTSAKDIVKSLRSALRRMPPTA